MSETDSKTGMHPFDFCDEDEMRFVRLYARAPGRTPLTKSLGISPKKLETFIPEMMAKPNVANAVAYERDRLLRRMGFEKKRILDEYAKIAFSDIRDIMEWTDTGVTLIASEEIDDAAAGAIQEVSETITNAGGTVKVKMYDKKAALDKLAEITGLLKGADGMKTPGDRAREVQDALRAMDRMELGQPVDEMSKEGLTAADVAGVVVPAQQTGAPA